MSRRISSAFEAVRLAKARIPGNPPRILVAEDDGEMRSLLLDALRRDGYEVCEAEDGGRLLAQVADASKPLDLVISDIRMPICTGLAILEAMRRTGLSVPVILMTAFGDQETRALVEGLGAILFDKPFGMDDLRTAVLNLVPLT